MRPLKPSGVRSVNSMPSSLHIWLTFSARKKRREKTFTLMDSTVTNKMAPVTGEKNDSCSCLRDILPYFRDSRVQFCFHLLMFTLSSTMVSKQTGWCLLNPRIIHQLKKCVTKMIIYNALNGTCWKSHLDKHVRVENQFSRTFYAPKKTANWKFKYAQDIFSQFSKFLLIQSVILLATPNDWENRENRLSLILKHVLKKFVHK